MPNEHAPLGPSSSERWISCPASVQLAKRFPNSESSYAREGTIAHGLAELKASLAFGKISSERYAELYQEWEVNSGFDDEQIAEAGRHTDAYVALLRERVAEHPGAHVMLERRVETGVEHCWGTADALIIADGLVEVVDFKYGAGVAVSAYDNSQLKLYGLGVLELVESIFGDVHTVRMSIHQPRRDSITSAEATPDELRSWREEVVRPAAAEAFSGGARFGPSESACRWCPAAGECRARMEAATAEDFGADPELLEPEEIADLLHRIPAIKSWCAAVEDTALHKAYSEDVALPGWKVIQSGGRRSIPDSAKAIAVLTEAGYDEDDISERKLATLGKLEKLIGKDELPDLLGALLVAGEGKPSLAPESSSKPALNRNAEAAKAFEEDS